jgi:hypothetical protein
MTGNPDSKATLGALEAEERALSRERAQLHRRIEFIAGGGAGGDDLASLAQRERELSAQRKALHKLIDEERERLGLPPWQRPTRDARDRLG